MKLETLATHAGRRIDPATGAVREPIHLATTFERGIDGRYPRGYYYSRSGNPNRASLEQAIAALEHGAGAVAFASGSRGDAGRVRARQEPAAYRLRLGLLLRHR